MHSWIESTIQSLQLSTQEMSTQLAQTRMQYKVSVSIRHHDEGIY